MQEPNRIDTVVWDADNTLWDWIKMHLSGMQAMAKKISCIINTPEDDVKRSMARVYQKAGSFDYKSLVQEMDIVEAWAAQIQPEREKIRRVIDLGFAVHTAYTHSRNVTFQMYPDIPETLNELQQANVSNVILSDAPISKIIRRLKYFDIEKYFDLACGRPEVQVAEERERGESNLPYYETTRKETGAYDTDVTLKILSSLKKPEVDLSKLLDKTPIGIQESVAIVGDNFDKDIGTAWHNQCYGFFARYGAADRDSVSGLHEFGPPGVVTRNVAGIDLSKVNLDLIQSMGNKLKIVDDVREIAALVLSGHAVRPAHIGR